MILKENIMFRDVHFNLPISWKKSRKSVHLLRSLFEIAGICNTEADILKLRIIISVQLGCHVRNVMQVSPNPITQF